MKVNVGFTDRIIRILLVVAIAGLFTNQMIIGIGAIVLGSIAVIFLLTSVFGVCPLYTLIGVDTIPKT